jgi:hypothetical protein
LRGGYGYGKDTLDGGEGDDELYGNRGDDILTGGAGDDLLNGKCHRSIMHIYNAWPAPDLHVL